MELHPSDAAALSLSDGERALVRTEAGEAALPVRVTEHVAAGAAFVPFNQPGLAANALLSGQMLARARVSPVEGGAATETAVAVGQDGATRPAAAVAGGNG